jgi:hypothetical protein
MISSGFFEVIGIDIPVTVDHAEDRDRARTFVHAIEYDIRIDDVRPESRSNLFSLTSRKREDAQNPLCRCESIDKARNS